MCGATKSLLCLLAVITHIPAIAENNVQSDLQKYMLHQLVELRTELAEYFFEGQQSKLAATARELVELRREQKELQEEIRVHGDQVAQLERQLTSADLEPQVRPQIEAVRAHLTSESAEKLRSRQAALTQREAELTQRLERETQRSRFLEEKARQLRAALNQK